MPELERCCYVVGLGANLGDARATLRSAVAALARLGQVRAVSHLYETDPVGPPQPRYLNAAAALETTLRPQELLGELLRIEREHGRERRVRWGARTLDLDLLYCPGLSLSEPGLTLPHPELTRRAFALVPLLEVAAEAREPGTDRPYADLAAALSREGLRRIETSPTWWSREGGIGPRGGADSAANVGEAE
jgi:2-amino-4-hydroxy-6-hydroxymethyldihydropteridine diphosphokinase